MSDLISEIYPHALDCGISPERFWNLSILEVTDIIESVQRQEKSRIKQKLMNSHFLAQDIGQYTAVAVQGSDNVKIMELWDYFPELFLEEKKEWQERQAAVYKAQMIDFAYRHNHARAGGES